MQTIFMRFGDSCFLRFLYRYRYQSIFLPRESMLHYHLLIDQANRLARLRFQARTFQFFKHLASKDMRSGPTD